MVKRIQLHKKQLRQFLNDANYKVDPKNSAFIKTLADIIYNAKRFSKIKAIINSNQDLKDFARKRISVKKRFEIFNSSTELIRSLIKKSLHFFNQDE